MTNTAPETDRPWCFIIPPAFIAVSLLVFYWGLLKPFLER